MLRRWKNTRSIKNLDDQFVTFLPTGLLFFFVDYFNNYFIFIFVFFFLFVNWSEFLEAQIHICITDM